MAEEFDDNQEQADEQSEEQVDPVRNVQAEMNRKLENTNAIIQKQQEQLQALMEAMTAQNAAKQPQRQQVNYKEAIFDNPEAVVEDIVRRSQQAADEAVNRRLQTAQTTSQVANEIASKYTEFSQPGSQAYLLAVQNEAKQPAHIRGTAEGIRLAMMDAVAELGLSPSSKRQKQAEDFTFGSQGTGGAANRKPSRTADPKKDIDPVTLQMAELLGVDINDPKRIEGLRKASQRKRWNGYE